MCFDVIGRILEMPEGEFTAQLNVRIPAELMEQVRAVCLRKNMTLRNFIIVALETKVARHENNSKQEN